MAQAPDTPFGTPSPHSALVDTFARDRLPPPQAMPEFLF